MGDTLPPLSLSTISANGKAQPVSLRGKLTILDFWATWCTSCLKNFPKMEAIQGQLGPAVQVILVNTASTGDKEKTVMAFFQKRRNKNGQAFKLPTVVEDTILGRFFPHKLIPHYVWIDSGGKVLAITGADEVSSENIAAFLGGKSLRLPVKHDVTDYNNTLPLLHEGNGGSMANLLQSSSFTAYLPGLGSGTRFYKDSLVQKTTWLNASILSLYRAALGYSANRLVLLVPDSARFFRSLNAPQDWHNQLFCYELTLPVHTAPAAAKRVMRQDLDMFFGLSGRMEYRKTPCWP
jgi:thiol-disulfide isomerase/thioredoxin